MHRAPDARAMHVGGLLRLTHVAAAAIVVAGALVAAARPAVARRYEWAFWTAVLVLGATGIGNLGSLGELRPGEWLLGFRAKLVAILALVLVSAARLLALVTGAPPHALRSGYVASAALGGAVLGLGVVIAHV